MTLATLALETLALETLESIPSHALRLVPPEPHDPHQR